MSIKESSIYKELVEYLDTEFKKIKDDMYFRIEGEVFTVHAYFKDEFLNIRVFNSYTDKAITHKITVNELQFINVPVAVIINDTILKLKLELQ